MAGSQGLAQSAERESPDFDLMALGLGLLFAQPEDRHLRLTINTGRDARRIQPLLPFAGHVFDRGNAFFRGGMGQQRRPVHITNRIDCRIGGLHLLVDLDIAALDPDTSRFQTKLGTDRSPTDSYQNLIGGAFLEAAVAVQINLNPARIFFQAVKHGLGQDLNALFLERAFQFFGDFGIDPGQELLFHLNHRHPAAERAVDIGELHPNRPAADNDEGFGDGLLRQGLITGENLFAINLKAGQGPLAGTGGNQNTLGFDLLRLLTCNHHAIITLNPARPLEKRHLVLFEQVFHPFGQSAGHLARTLDDLGIIKRQPAHLDAVVLPVFEVLIHLCRGQNGFGRNTAPVQAHPTGPVLLHNGDVQAQLDGPNRCHITPGACSDYHQVIAFHCSPLHH